MSKLNTALNVIGTVASLKSLFGGDSGGAQGKLGNFISEIRNSSVAKTNLFDVEVTPPRILGGSETARKLSLYAEGAQLPGRNIQTDQLKRFGVGPQEKVPYSMQYNDITLNFIGDGKGEIYKFFYRWMHGIVRGDYSVSSPKADSNGKAPYEVQFKDQYAVPITITMYNEQGSPVLVSKLIDAFPVNVSEVGLNWSDSNMMTFPVTFSYLYTELSNADAPAIETPNGFAGLSNFQNLVKIGTAVQTISSLRKPRNIQDALSSVNTIKNLFN